MARKIPVKMKMNGMSYVMLGNVDGAEIPVKMRMNGMLYVMLGNGDDAENPGHVGHDR